MSEDNEKVEDFISLWKKKMEQENNKPASISNTTNKLDLLQQENQQLRDRIAENIQLISKAEEIIRNAAQEKEKLRLEKEQNQKEVNIRLNQLEAENAELSDKVKSMVQLNLEKDKEINNLHTTISNLQEGNQNDVNLAIIQELKLELTKYKQHITDLEQDLLEKKEENEELQKQLVEKMKSLPIDYVLPVKSPDSSVIIPSPPESPSIPLEALCQDLQTDLNKHKKIIDKLQQENSELKSTLEGKDIQFTGGDIQNLQQENEALKNDIESLQNQLKLKENTDSISINLSNLEEKISDLEFKLQEKDKIITELKLNQVEQKAIPAGQMSGLVDDLQKSINKLKLTIKEKDHEIAELKKLSGI